MSTIGANAPEVAMVLAAGLGTRMRPITDTMPKPLVPVRGKPLIDYTLDLFRSADLKRAVVNVHYFADQLEEHLQSRRQPEIVIADERAALLETGGGLKNALPLFNGAEAVYCTNTDAILLPLNDRSPCDQLASLWDPARMDVALLLTPIEAASGYDGAGDFDLSSDGRATFRSGAHAPFVFTGLQIISTSLVKTGPEGAFSTRTLWEQAVARGRLFAVVHDGAWLHVGDPQGLRDAEAHLASAR